MHYNLATTIASFDCLAGIKTVVGTPLVGLNNNTVQSKRAGDRLLWAENFGPLPGDVKASSPQSNWLATTLQRVATLDFMAIQKLFEDGAVKQSEEDLKNVSVALTWPDGVRNQIWVDLSDPAKVIDMPDSANEALWVTAIEAAGLKQAAYQGLSEDKARVNQGRPEDAMRMITGVDYVTYRPAIDGDPSWVKQCLDVSVFCKTSNSNLNHEGVLGRDTWYAVVDWVEDSSGAAEIKLSNATLDKPLTFDWSAVVEDLEEYVFPDRIP